MFTVETGSSKPILQKLDVSQNLKVAVENTYQYYKKAEEYRDRVKPEWKKEWDALQRSSTGMGNRSPR